MEARDLRECSLLLQGEELGPTIGSLPLDDTGHYGAWSWQSLRCEEVNVLERLCRSDYLLECCEAAGLAIRGVGHLG